MTCWYFGRQRATLRDLGRRIRTLEGVIKDLSAVIEKLVYRAEVAEQSLDIKTVRLAEAERLLHIAHDGHFGYAPDCRGCAFLSTAGGRS